MPKRNQKLLTLSHQTGRFSAVVKRRQAAVIAAVAVAVIGFTALSYTSASTNSVHANAEGSLLTPATSFTKHSNLRYSDASTRLLLDVYTPNKTTPGPTPLIVFVHGGSWRTGNKDSCMPAKDFGSGTFMNRGYAVACINYRYSTEAIYPAQIQDVKASIRWLRANADTYNIYAGKIAIWGVSAGGHLAALAGTTSDITSYDVGNNLQFSSKVDAVVDYYGPTDLVDGNTGPGTKTYENTLKLIGGDGSDFNVRAAAASPTTYVTSDDTPFHIVHGTKDSVVPIRQSHLMNNKLKESLVSSELIAITGAGHGGTAFTTATRFDAISKFLDSLLR